MYNDHLGKIMACPLSAGEVILAIRTLVQQPVNPSNAQFVKEKAEMLRGQLDLLRQTENPVQLPDALRKACLSLSLAAEICPAFGEVHVDQVLRALGEQV